MKPAPPHGGHFRTRKLDLAEPTSLREKVSRPGPGVPEPQSPWDLGGGWGSENGTFLGSGPALLHQALGLGFRSDRSDKRPGGSDSGG